MPPLPENPCGYDDDYYTTENAFVSGEGGEFMEELLWLHLLRASYL